jgi:hypothetical protein
LNQRNEKTLVNPRNESTSLFLPAISNEQQCLLDPFGEDCFFLPYAVEFLEPASRVLCFIIEMSKGNISIEDGSVLMHETLGGALELPRSPWGLRETLSSLTLDPASVLDASMPLLVSESEMIMVSPVDLSVFTSFKTCEAAMQMSG